MKVLMVCLGNICRSPLAEGILRNKIESRHLDWTVDSAGTAGYHSGQEPDHRSIAIALKHGIDISNQSARQFKASDFDAFDRILTMDSQNYQDVVRLSTDDQQEKVELILNYLHPDQNQAVPDPYYGGTDGFANVYKMLDQACEAFIDRMITTDFK